MTVAELLNSVQFVVDRSGKRKAVVLDLSIWEALIEALEDLENTAELSQYEIDEEAIFWTPTKSELGTFDTLTDDELMALYGEATQEDMELAEAGLTDYADGLKQEDMAR